MPELPEVETVRRSLSAVVNGYTIQEVLVSCVAQIRRPPHDATSFRSGLVGARINTLSRRGKHLIFHLNKNRYLLAHLGMTGRLLMMPHDALTDKHTHVVIALEGGMDVRYHDVRRFGGLSYWARSPYTAPPLSLLGPEPLSDDFSADYFLSHLRRRRSPIKTALLDQHLVAGLGNIYADEALFRAGLSPTRPASDLGDEECLRLVMVIKALLAEAITVGGSSVRDYVDADGKSGSFQERHQVYGRAGNACVRCGTQLVKTTLSGRTSTFCPHCQT